VEPGHGVFTRAADSDVESEKHLAAAQSLPGVSGIVSLNRTLMSSQVKSYDELDRQARALGADLVAVYRFDEGKRNSDIFVPLTLASLGLAPTKTYQIKSHVTLMVRDARTGYIYGVLEESGESGGLTAEMDVHNAAERSRHKARQRALDRMAEKLPTFWSSAVLSKGR
jgi:uncharacterized protein YbjQ (UPF0145 family)